MPEENYLLNAIYINPVANGYTIKYSYFEEENDYESYNKVFVFHTWGEIVNHLSNNTMDVKNER